MIVTIIIPCFNEEAFIERCVISLMRSKLKENMVLEFIIVDGISTDRTKQIALALAEKYENIVVIDNQYRKVSPGLNAAIKIAKGEYIVRADCHAEYPIDYVLRLIGFLELHDAVNVGAALVNLPGDNSIPAKIINAAMGSVFGVGSSFRTLKGLDPVSVDTVPFGCWKRDAFEIYGEFDISFDRGQDLEFNTRCRKAGGKIYCLPDLKVGYFNRVSFKSFLKMIFQIGFWKHYVNRKHGILSSFRQLVPIGFTVFILSILPITFIGNSLFLLLYLLGCSIYGIAAIMAAVKTLNGLKPVLWLRSFFGLLWVFPAMHFIYGFGFLEAVLLDFLGTDKKRSGETSR